MSIKGPVCYLLMQKPTFKSGLCKQSKMVNVQLEDEACILPV